MTEHGVHRILFFKSIVVHLYPLLNAVPPPGQDGGKVKFGFRVGSVLKVPINVTDWWGQIDTVTAMQPSTSSAQHTDIQHRRKVPRTYSQTNIHPSIHPIIRSVMVHVFVANICGTDLWVQYLYVLNKCSKCRTLVCLCASPKRHSESGGRMRAQL